MTKAPSTSTFTSATEPQTHTRKVALTRSGSGSLHLIEESDNQQTLLSSVDVTNTTSNLQQSKRQHCRDLEIVAALDEEACNVCGRFEPPQLHNAANNRDSAPQAQIVDWAQCDICAKWVHFKFCCDECCMGLDGTFICPICSVKV